jgi:N6-L-threonylcarbamoyladenine synthase
MFSISHMKILGIETSCDETAISLIEVNQKKQTVHILGNTVHSQIDIHASYGGVFPTLAKREHQANLVPVLARTLAEAGIHEVGKTPLPPEVEEILFKDYELFVAFNKFVPKIKKPDIDFISVTMGPGLEPALWVGICFARALSLTWNIPLIACNHMEGHILTALISKHEDLYKLLEPKLPALSLLISGGHTQIVLMEKPGTYKILGDTRDDAIGECFDKIARTLGLQYPGGPKISKLASEARKECIESPKPLPRPMIDSDNLDFSFSGLKTAVLYLVQELTKGTSLTDNQVKGIARETEDSVTDVIISKIQKAAEEYAAESIVVGGGVIANKNIREHLEKFANNSGITLLLPQFDHATDNGLMIALAGYFNRDKALKPGSEIKATGTLPLGPRS